MCGVIPWNIPKKAFQRCVMKSNLKAKEEKKVKLMDVLFCAFWFMSIKRNDRGIKWCIQYIIKVHRGEETRRKVKALDKYVVSMCCFITSVAIHVLKCLTMAMPAQVVILNFLKIEHWDVAVKDTLWILKIECGIWLPTTYNVNSQS